MRSRGSVVALVVVVLLFGLSAGSVPAESSDELTPAAAAAVKRLFPSATIMGVGQEREQGVRYYEVVVHDRGERIEVEVTADGAIGEIESVVRIADVPEAAREQILWNTRDAAVEQVERHEVRGVARNGTFAPVDPPVVLYEIEYADGGRTRELVVAEDGSRPSFELDGSADDDDSEDDEEDG